MVVFRLSLCRPAAQSGDDQPSRLLHTRLVDSQRELVRVTVRASRGAWPGGFKAFTYSQRASSFSFPHTLSSRVRVSPVCWPCFVKQSRAIDGRDSSVHTLYAMVVMHQTKARQACAAATRAIDRDGLPVFCKQIVVHFRFVTTFYWFDFAATA